MLTVCLLYLLVSVLVFILGIFNIRVLYLYSSKDIQFKTFVNKVSQFTLRKSTHKYGQQPLPVSIVLKSSSDKFGILDISGILLLV